MGIPQNLADMKLSKELLNLGRSNLTGVMMIYTILIA